MLTFTTFVKQLQLIWNVLFDHVLMHNLHKVFQGLDMSGFEFFSVSAGSAP